MQKRPGSLKTAKGFSLAELLIALAIIGVLATFTIPPMLQSANGDQNSKYTAMAKSTALMIIMAYDRYRSENSPVSTTINAGNLIKYLNYVGYDSSSTVDDHPNYGTVTCNTPGTDRTCLKLHNGGILWFDMAGSCNFSGTSSTNAIYLNFDPDGNNSPGTNKAISFDLYYDGTLRSKGTGRTNTYACGNPSTTGAGWDPTWFNGF